MRIVTAAEMRQIEDTVIETGVSVEELMRRAGRAVADTVVEAFGGQIVGRRVLLLAGPGKNGGDGLIAARILRQRGASVSVVCPIPRADTDSLLQECAAAGCSIMQDISAELDSALSRAGVIVDALLGTGRSRVIEGPMLDALQLARAAASGSTVVAIDLPSGLDSDTGEADPSTLTADVTVALGAVKQGCLSVAGAEHSGAIRVADIGLARYATDGTGPEILTANTVHYMLPKRRAAGHKGTFGHSLIIGGAESYRGAPALAARAAARAGSGTVAIAAPETITDSIAPMAPEATHLPLRVDSKLMIAPKRALIQMMATFQLNQPTAVAIGPGLGNPVGYQDFFTGLIDLTQDDVPLVFDADGLNALSDFDEWWENIDNPSVITPHPGEMARLCDTSVEDVQRDRIGIAVAKAREWGVTVALKGAYTVVASPDERPSICPLAFPALASGGTGDALAGIITGFLSQGLTTSAAARAGVYVHGTAAALAARKNDNMASGLLASDLIYTIPAAMDVIRRGEGPVPPMFA